MNKAQRHLYRAIQLMNARGLAFGADSDDDVEEVLPFVNRPSAIAQRNQRNAERAQRKQKSKDVSDPREAIVLDGDDAIVLDGDDEDPSGGIPNAPLISEDDDAVVLIRDYDEEVEEGLSLLPKHQKRRQQLLENRNAMHGGDKKRRQQYLQNKNAMAVNIVSLAERWRPLPKHLIQDAPDSNQPKDVGGEYLSDEFMPDVTRNNASFHNFQHDPIKYIKDPEYAGNYSPYQRDHRKGLERYQERYTEITVQQKCRDIRNLLDCGGAYQSNVRDLQSKWTVKPTDTLYRDYEQQTRRFLWGIAMFVSNWPLMNDEFEDIKDVGAFNVKKMERDNVSVPTKKEHFIYFKMWDEGQASRYTKMYYLHEKIGKFFNYRKSGRPAATKTVHPENMLDYFHGKIEPEKFPNILMNSMSNVIHSLWADLFVTQDYKVRAIDDVLLRWLQIRREVYEAMVGGCIEGTLRDIQDMFLRESTTFVFDEDKSKMENIRSLLSKLLCKWCDEAMTAAKSLEPNAGQVALDKKATEIILQGLTHHSLTELPHDRVREAIKKMKSNAYHRPLNSLPTYLFKGISDSEILGKTTLYKDDRKEKITVSDIMLVVSASGDTWLGLTPTDLNDELRLFGQNFKNEYSHVFAIKDKCIQANRESWSKMTDD